MPEVDYMETENVAVYEYYCRTCDTKFEKLQAMSASTQAVDCPQGHPAVRTLSLIARPTGGTDDAFDWSAGGTGGCGCGGACSCGSYSAN
jgi:putative FmdB family regulatory protein